VNCVITARSLPVSEDNAECRSDTDEGREDALDPHEHCPRYVAKYPSLSPGYSQLREMAWKRSSVRSRPGPPNPSAISVFDSSHSAFVSSLIAFHYHRSRLGYEPENCARMLTDTPQDEHFTVTHPPISGNQTSFLAPQLRQRICAGDGSPYCSSTLCK